MRTFTAVIAPQTFTRKTAIPKSVLRLAGDAVLDGDSTTYPVGGWLQITHFKSSGPLLASEGQNMLTCLPIGDGIIGLQLTFLLADEGSEPSSVICIEIHPQFLAQWPQEILAGEAALRFDHTAEHQLPANAGNDALLGQIVSALPLRNLDAGLRITETVLSLLRRALSQIANPFTACPVPACRFLLYESEREKIRKARDILDACYDERMTIKSLAQKVAMNECYLKKGFKTLVGCTIHEYISRRRIATARRMLESEGRSVTEVAAQLGYSSISHFSTAFKQATGIKPCELLR